MAPPGAGSAIAYTARLRPSQARHRSRSSSYIAQQRFLLFALSTQLTSAAPTGKPPGRELAALASLNDALAATPCDPKDFLQAVEDKAKEPAPSSCTEGWRMDIRTPRSGRNRMGMRIAVIG